MGPPDRESTLRSIGIAAELSTLGANLYDAEPGEQLPLAYHSHEEQEELFFVLEGTLSVEIPEATLTVESGEVVVAEPERPHREYVDGDAEEPVRALAVGAPIVDDVQLYDPSSEDASDA